MESNRIQVLYEVVASCIRIAVGMKFCIGSCILIAFHLNHMKPKFEGIAYGMLSSLTTHVGISWVRLHFPSCTGVGFILGGCFKCLCDFFYPQNLRVLLHHLDYPNLEMPVLYCTTL